MVTRTSIGRAFQVDLGPGVEVCGGVQRTGHPLVGYVYAEEQGERFFQAVRLPVARLAPIGPRIPIGPGATAGGLLGSMERLAQLATGEPVKRLDEALIMVADAARELVNGADMGKNGSWVIGPQEMHDLRSALGAWERATEAARRAGAAGDAGRKLADFDPSSAEG